MSAKTAAASSPIYVTRPYLPPRAEYDAELDRIFAAAQLTNGGSTLRRFRVALAASLGLDSPERLALFANGHLALEAALRVLLPEEDGGEVITTPFTFASTAHAIVRCGFTPVFCDVKPSDLTMDESKLEQCITGRTRMILPVHVYGHPCSTRIDDIAHKRGLPLLYDAAHAFGVTQNGRSLASRGSMSMLSFHATKPFHTIEGGAVVIGNETVSGTGRLLRQAKLMQQQADFGIAGAPQPETIGGNGKMNAFEAAMGLCCLPHLPEITVRRRALTWHYREQLAELPGLQFFTPDALHGVEYNYAYLPVLVDPVAFGCSRDALWQFMQKNGVYARRYFWPAVPDYPCYHAAFGDSDVPVARHAAARVLCLPLYDSLSFQQVDRVCGLLQQAHRSGELL